VGLPRSGSTLIEQILASHSQVEGTQELADIQRIVMELRGRDTDLENPRLSGRAGGADAGGLPRFGERYMTDTRASRYTADARPFFIDKMPNNFRYIGLIHLMLPNAKIIDARREPMACCFGNLKQLFASGQEFSYSIEDIARYYRTYLELMRHWNEALPGRILTVQHEDVVETSRACAAHPGFLRPASSSRPAWSSTRPSAACARPVRSRCASPSSARASTSGGTTSPGWAHCAIAYWAALEQIPTPRACCVNNLQKAKNRIRNAWVRGLNPLCAPLI
jgi:hypothetical protein